MLYFLLFVDVFCASGELLRFILFEEGLGLTCVCAFDWFRVV